MKVYTVSVMKNKRFFSNIQKEYVLKLLIPDFIN